MDASGAKRWRTPPVVPTGSQQPLSNSEVYDFDHSVGTLHVEGELKGYLACVVGEMRFPSRQLWPWFVVIWTTGTKEQSFEDYGPRWPILRELVAGRLDHYGPSVIGEKRLFGRRIVTSGLGAPCLFDYGMLSAEQAAKKWRELDLVDADF